MASHKSRATLMWHAYLKSAVAPEAIGQLHAAAPSVPTQKLSF
jgi:hypothetical protein